ncbi:hypothetical protein PYCCODRAFT_1462030 [Trametes coccinea BRFM310]|uniref:Uncharacterized protein n=1 Tax=Trametes coccinea (strain BRFM310) TaxID=1353009 RepID=A0A1Y2I7U6_TRAC3|nr:hypothetical protein PYCCODRAFT_1462030 [Trametes coccinea BRFM310]
MSTALPQAPPVHTSTRRRRAVFSTTTQLGLVALPPSARSSCDRSGGDYIMSSFSRVIARPKANAKQPALGVVVAEPSCFNGHAQSADPSHLSPGMDLPLMKQTSSIVQDGDCQHQSWDRSNYAGDFVKPFPRLFTLARTASLRSMPSLCSDDSFTDSLRSSSPVSPHSPLPTACSTMAVLGSAGHLSSFEEEYDRPEAHVDFVRRKLAENWYLRRQARMRDGNSRETNTKKDSNVSEARIAPGPGYQCMPSAIPAHTYTQTYSGGAAASSPRSTSRLSQRVRTPPPLNVAAIKAHAMLAKMLGQQYDVEIGDVDGSVLTDSGNEADNEGEHSSPDESTLESRKAAEFCNAQSTGLLPSAGRAAALESSRPKAQSQTKMSYAAVLATSSRAAYSTK